MRSVRGLLPDAVRFARGVLLGFLAHDGPTLAAAIAYYALLSIFPLVLAALSVGAGLLDEAGIRTAVRRTLESYLPSDAVAVVLRNVEEAIRLRGPVGIAAVVTSLWAASAAAGAARHALNRVWGVDRERVFWWRKLTEILVTVVVGAILAASFGVSVALSLAERLGPRLVPEILRLLSGLVGVRIGLPFLAFLVSYRLLPNHPLRLARLWPGALGAAVLFEGARRIALWGIGTFTRYQLVYGSLAGVVVFLVWAYLAATVFLLGAEINRHVSTAPIGSTFGSTTQRAGNRGP